MARCVLLVKIRVDTEKDVLTIDWTEADTLWALPSDSKAV